MINNVEVLLYIHRNCRFITLLGMEAQDAHLNFQFHTAPELCSSITRSNMYTGN